MKKDQKEKSIGKVNENVWKEKSVRKSIGRNKAEVDDYQDHMIGRSHNHDITLQVFKIYITNKFYKIT